MAKLGKYELLEPLGSGAFAEVHKALDTALKRTVALKVLKPALIADEEAFARFVQEAQTAAGLFHPHIATVLDLGEVDGRYFIAMRYVDGQSLDKIIQQGAPLPWDHVLRITQHIAEALQFAHDKGLVHRDVKPANIIISPTEGAVLTDFGLVKALESSGLSTRSGAVLGTPQYIPPEVWNGQPAGPAADQYALACILAEMLTGKVLFGASTPWAVLQKQAAPPELPEQWPQGVPVGVEAVLRKALSKEPGGRYADVKAFHAALERLNAAQAKPAQPVGQPTPTPAAPPQARPAVQAVKEKAPAPSTGRPTAFSRLPTWALAVAGVFAAGVLLVSLILIAGFLIGRGGFGSQEALAPTATTALAAPLERSSTPTAAPMPSHTPPQGPTATFVPSPTMALPVWMETPIPLPAEPISKLNVQQIVEFAQLDIGVDVQGLAFSGDGKLLASYSQNGDSSTTIYVYSLEASQLIHRFEVADGCIISIALAGDTLAVGSCNESILLWRISDGSALPTIPYIPSFRGLVLSPDGRFLIASEISGGEISLWQVEGAIELDYVTIADRPPALALSQNGKILATTGDELRIWDVSSQHFTPIDSFEHPYSQFQYQVVFAPSENLLGTNDGTTLRLWDTVNVKYLYPIPASEVDFFTFSLDSTLIAAIQTASSTVTFWDVASTTNVFTISHGESIARDLAFSPGGEFLAIGLDDGTIHLWGVP